MRVLHVYRTYFPDPAGGIQEAIRQICMATQPLGVQSRVFTLSPSPIPVLLNRPESDVFRSRSWMAPASCDIGDWRAVRQFRRLAQESDIIHYHFPWPFGDLLHLLAGGDRPSILTYHSDIVRQQWLGQLYGPLMWRTLRHMRAIVATSPAYAHSSPVLRAFMSSKKLCVIPLGIADQSEATRAAQNNADATLGRLKLDKDRYFLSLGVLRYYKGLHTLVHAAYSVNAKIVIAGDGPERQKLQAMAAQIGVKNIVFTGAVTDEEKFALMQNCRAFVLPSHLRSEAFGMVLVEAAMCGRPMISCEIESGTSYVNENKVTGFVIAPEAIDRLAQVMNELLANDSLAQRMGQAARARYEQLFSGPALGSNYARLYSGIAGD